MEGITIVVSICSETSGTRFGFFFYCHPVEMQEEGGRFKGDSFV